MAEIIEVIEFNGSVHLMANHRDYVCDTLVSGEGFEDFAITIWDASDVPRKSATSKEGKKFIFNPEQLGQLFSVCIHTESAKLIEEICGSPYELYDYVECREIHYGLEKPGDDGEFGDCMISEVKQGLHPRRFFYRMKQLWDKRWVLCLVFYDQEIESLPIEWPDFTW